MIHEVDYVSGHTRLYAIIGHPIAQVRSPELFTASFKARGADALLVPFHVLPDEFDRTVPAMMAMPNLDGLIFTIPYKQRAMAYANEIGSNAQIVGAINALARNGAGGWKADIFDGLGCVEAFRRRGLSFAGKRIMLIGAGGAGSAIAIAIAHENPHSIQLYDLDVDRALTLVRKIQSVDPSIQVERAEPTVKEIDILLNASPVGMLEDERLPIAVNAFDPALVVFDAIVKPETTPLLKKRMKPGARLCGGEK